MSVAYAGAWNGSDSGSRLSDLFGFAEPAFDGRGEG
jgi:hypothetical protein